MSSDQLSSSEFDYFDSINLQCIEHSLPIIGCCAELTCTSNRLVCLKCLKISLCFNPDSSLTTHELNSIGTLLIKFFNLKSKSAMDLNEFNDLMEIVKSINKSELKVKVNLFKNTLKTMFELFSNEIYKALETEIEILHTTLLLELNTIEEKYVNSLRPSQILSSDISELLYSDTNQNLKQTLLDDKLSFDSKLSIINTLKIFNDEKFVVEEIENIDNIRYISKLEAVASLEKAVEDKAEDLIRKVEENLNEIERIIFPSEKDALGRMKDLNEFFEGNPESIRYVKDITENAHKANSIDGVFTVFKSSKNEYLCVWGTQTFQISGYDFVKDKLVFTYQNAHSSTIFTTRHYFDKKEKQDLILTSSHDKSVKTWLLANGNISPILTISNAQNGCYIYSSCILFTENNDSSVIITSAPNEFQKVWSFKGKHIKDFGVNTESTYFVDSFYDGKTKKSFILNANSVDVKAYSFPDYQLFKSFKGTPNSWHMSVKMIDRNNVLTLVESDGNGTIRLWDFYEGVEILKVNTTGLNLRGICVWNVNSIFASSSDYHVKLYNIKEMKMSKTFHEHKSTVCALNKICVPKIGECLVSHGLDGKLKLWVCDKVKKVV